MKWAPSCSERDSRCSGPLMFPAGLGFYSWKKPPSITCGSKFLSRAKLGQPGIFKIQKTFVVNKRKKNGERSKVSRGKSAKTTLSCPGGWLFSESALALPRTLPQVQAEKRATWAVETDP